MPFENLTDRFQSVFKRMRKEATLTEENIDAALKEIRVALLESDVNFKVVKAFLASVKEDALGQERLRRVNPGDQLVKICHDRLEELLGKDNEPLEFKKKPTIVMLAGLQGAGKTTTAGKLAYLAKNKLGKKVLLAGLDVYRPAAIEQLGTLAKEIDVDFFEMGTKANPVEVAKKAKEKVATGNYDVLILDTAGRLQIDESLMQELVNISEAIHPDETLLLVDAMAGQEAVNVAKSFHSQVHLTGLVMAKLDGDAKGGAALSIKYITGLPIKFAGVGEKIADLDIFYPDRMADRILGMGDVVTLVEKAKETIDEEEAEREARKMMAGTFTLEDMLRQMGNNDKKFKADGVKNAWLSANVANVHAYNNDPLCGFPFTVNGYRNGLFRLMLDIYSPKGWNVTNPDLPIHFIAGAEDPCIISLKKFSEAVSFLRARGYREVTSQVYPKMRHEILNETGREDVWRDVLARLDGWLAR